MTCLLIKAEYFCGNLWRETGCSAFLECPTIFFYFFFFFFLNTNRFYWCKIGIHGAQTRSLEVNQLHLTVKVWQQVRRPADLLHSYHSWVEQSRGWCTRVCRGVKPFVNNCGNNKLRQARPAILHHPAHIYIYICLLQFSCGMIPFFNWTVHF